MRVRGFVLALMVLALLLAGCGQVETYQPVKGTGLGREAAIKITDKGFDPVRLRLQAGIPTKVTVTNTSKARHSFVVEDVEGVEKIRMELGPGQSDSFDVNGSQVWQRKYYSDLPGDEEAGFVGELAMRINEWAP